MLDTPPLHAPLHCESVDIPASNYTCDVDISPYLSRLYAAAVGAHVASCYNLCRIVCGLAQVFESKVYDQDTKKYQQTLHCVELAAALALSDEERQRHLHVRKLTGTKFRSNNSACFSPDHQSIAFLSNRDGDTQVYTMPVNRPGEALQLTSIHGGALLLSSLPYLV